MLFRIPFSFPDSQLPGKDHEKDDADQERGKNKDSANQQNRKYGNHDRFSRSAVKKIKVDFSGLPVAENRKNGVKDGAE